MIKDSFDNLKKISDVRCPTFFVHGINDDIIPPDHSTQLEAKCRCKSSVHYPSEMDHNDIDYPNDVITPFIRFLVMQRIEIQD